MWAQKIPLSTIHQAMSQVTYIICPYDTIVKAEKGILDLWIYRNISGQRRREEKCRGPDLKERAPDPPEPKSTDRKSRCYFELKYKL